MRNISVTVCLLLLGGLWSMPAASQPAPQAGATIRDCAQCPEMVVVGPGKFAMGEDGHRREEPIHPVAIARFFAVGKYDVTFEEWDACAADGSCGGYRPYDAGWGRGRRPVINVSWDDAHSYVAWLSRKTGKPYRLLSEAEWEYVARAGTNSTFWVGETLGTGNANCDGCGSQWDDKLTAPVGSFKPNAFGVYDTIGNVTEWVEDRWNSNYSGAPTDGSAWTTGDPRRVVMRGGSWFNTESLQHSAYRNGDAPIIRNAKIGFRVALTLP